MERDGERGMEMERDGERGIETERDGERGRIRQNKRELFVKRLAYIP